ncbi:MAG: methionine--tRNA ligase [Planctomycetaceae bacterium]
MSDRQILVTSALPYANGHIHIGHLVEYIQTDIWVRFQKLRGNRCVYMCADDTHGTAIMLRAQKEGRSEEEVIAEMSESHQRDFAGFDIEFDNFGSTHSDENRELCGQLWQSIRDAGLVKEKDVEQLFDPEAGTFLADRFVRGTCPKCKAEDQPGDNCSKCGSTYTPAELIDPKSTISGVTPEVRTARHLFIELEQLRPFLTEWTQNGEHLQSEVANYLKGHFLGDELRDWDISRPAPYFGFEIPDAPGNYWYVWFDAPIGYIASTKQWCDANGENLDDWWKSDKTEIHHFIGKDITYFHTLFWPGMLKTAGYSLPEKVHIHGFLTVNGEKMSKSKGTFVQASTYLNHLPAQALRYYYATKLGPRLDDLDLNGEEFVTKVNSDLVNKVVNLASRSAKFVQGENLSEPYPDDEGLFEFAAGKADEIANAYEQCDYNRAMREIMSLADRANKYFDDKQPWTFRKDPERQDELRDVCSVGLNLFRQLVVYLAPVLPRLAQQTEELLGTPIANWDEVKTPLTGTPVSKFKHLMNRIEQKQVDAMTEESQEAAAEENTTSEFHAADTWQDGGEPLAAEPIGDGATPRLVLKKQEQMEEAQQLLRNNGIKCSIETGPECSITDFINVDLRVARIIEANHVEGAEKLLQLTLSLGGGETRNVFAGIKAAYEPEVLVGRQVVCVANLKPRKMKFGLSEGMVAACGPGGEEVFLLDPDEGAKPGMRIH